MVTDCIHSHEYHKENENTNYSYKMNMFSVLHKPEHNDHFHYYSSASRRHASGSTENNIRIHHQCLQEY